MKKYVSLLLIAVCVIGFAVRTQGQKIAIINESSEYLNVYAGAGTNYEVVTTINKDDFFYCDSILNEQWAKITALEWKRNGEQIEGFVFKNSILLLENLEIKKQKELIIQVLSKQKQLGEDFKEY